MKIANFTNWQILEHFGTGEETFTQKLEYQTGSRNLSIWGPVGWGDVEDASGKLTYTALLDYTKGGIEDIHFGVEKIELTLSVRSYKDKDDDEGEVRDFDIVIDAPALLNAKIEINNLPFYVSDLDIDLRNAEDIDGEVNFDKAVVTMTMGTND